PSSVSSPPSPSPRAVSAWSSCASPPRWLRSNRQSCPARRPPPYCCIERSRSCCPSPSGRAATSTGGSACDGTQKAIGEVARAVSQMAAVQRQPSNDVGAALADDAHHLVDGAPRVDGVRAVDDGALALHGRELRQPGGA